MLNGSWQIAKIRGIPIRLHFSWFIIFGLITWALATRYFPTVAPELPKATNWVRGAIAAIFLFLSVLIHELSHSFVAMYYRLPITSITLFIFGGVAQMRQEPTSPKVELQMAVAGPLSSYILAILFFIIYKLMFHLSGVRAVAFYLFQLNIILATFNLIPGFPMDGGRVLRALLWRRSGNFISATRIASKTGQRIAMFFILLGIFSLLTGYPNSIWFILIGWFLYTAAQSSYQQATIKDILTGIRVRDVMVHNVITVDASTPLTDLVNDYFLRYGYGGFPVVDNGSVVGIISLKEIKGVASDKWQGLIARGVMQPIDDSLIVFEDDEVSDILERMIHEDKGRLIVLRDGILSGLITRSGIMRYLQVKDELRI